MTAICTAYTTEPFAAFSDPPVELAGCRPIGYLYVNGWIDFSTVGFAVMTWIEVLHVLFKHACDWSAEVAGKVAEDFRSLIYIGRVL